MKKITQEQINAILQTVYSTNIPAQSFDALKKMFEELEEIKDKK